MGVFSSVKQKLAQGAVRILKQLYRKSPSTEERTSVPFRGIIEGGRFFLGTKTGLLYFDGEKLWCLFEGRVYGITHCRDRWYATWNYPICFRDKRLATAGSILSFRFDEEQIQDLRIETAPLDEELHQIDAWKEHLYVTDTAQNRVLKYSITPSGLSYEAAYYPRGGLQKGKKSDNYAHINSVFRRDGHVYLMYHNHTRHTGRASQVGVLDESWRPVRIVDTTADSAHNVFRDDEGIIYCDSRNGRLVREGRTLWKKDMYLRGFAASEEDWFIGGSAFAERSERDHTPAYVYRLDRDTKELKNELRISGCGSLYEIRLLDPPDRAMSSFTAGRFSVGDDQHVA